jgi:hypothetical protein
MYLGGDWEYFYVSALVDFANATSKDRRAAAEKLLSSFESRATFNDRELAGSHAKARSGIETALRWDRVSSKRRNQWVRSMNSAFSSYGLGFDVPAVISFEITEKDGLVISPARPTMSVALLQATFITVALCCGHKSRWRKRLARCELPACEQLFVVGGLKRGKPKSTCCEEHSHDLHKLQMKVANGFRLLKKPRDENEVHRPSKRRTELNKLQTELEAAKRRAKDRSSRKLWP